MPSSLKQKPPNASHIKIGERLIGILVRCLAWLLIGMLVWVLWSVFLGGLGELSFEFITGEVENAGRKGGIAPIIFSTLIILLITVVVAAPLALLTAIKLSECMRGKKWFATYLWFCLCLLASTPSIVFGLFGNALFCVTLDLGYSLLSGGLTLACMVLPIMTFAATEAISRVPEDQRRGAYALGLSRTTCLFRLELPHAMPALLTGLVLGAGRALAETAALLFTSGYVTRYPGSLLDSGRSISVHIYDLAMNVPGGGSRAYATGLILIAILLVANLCLVFVSRVTGHLFFGWHLAKRT